VNLLNCGLQNADIWGVANGRVVAGARGMIAGRVPRVWRRLPRQLDTLAARGHNHWPGNILSLIQSNAMANGGNDRSGPGGSDCRRAATNS